MTVKELQQLVAELKEKVAQLEEENRLLKSQSKQQRNRRTFLVNIPLWTRLIENAQNIVSVGNDAQKCYLTGRQPAKFATIRLTTDMVANRSLRKVIYDFINSTNGQNSEQKSSNNGSNNNSNDEVDFDDDDIF